ncbi:unnamed protein product [Arabidopsis halleri]
MDGGNNAYCSSSLSPSPLLNFLNTNYLPLETRDFSKGSFSRSSAFCNLSSSSSSDTQKHLGTTLPFLPNPPTETTSPLTFTEDLLLSKQMELQFLSDELQLAITDRAETPRLDDIYQVNHGQNCVPAAMSVTTEPSPGSAVNHRPRMRSSPELHERFLEAVNKLEGPEISCFIIDEDIEPPSHIIQAPYVPSGPMTRTRSKGLEKKFNIFLEQLEREGLIPLDQFEAIRLTSSESSQLKVVLNEVPPTTQDDPGDEPHTKLKLSESTFRSTKDLPEISYKSPDMGRTASVCLVDSLINNEAKWALFTPKLEAHLSTCSLVLEGI